jgi:hypothetical protein
MHQSVEMPSDSSASARYDFDIDSHLNKLVPAPRLHILPKPISRLLGYRTSPQPPIGQPLIWLWAFIGAFTGLSLVAALFHVLPVPNTPIILASFGASAILEYNAISSPLSQPRNLILGQLLSATVGVSITKLFQLSPHFENLRWLAGALAVATSSALMGVSKTVHPPAGATALLAATAPDITALGWNLLPLDLLGSAALLVVACVVNNVQRQFPLYWWTEHALRAQARDAEKGRGSVSDEASVRHVEYVEDGDRKIVVTGTHVKIPSDVELSNEDVAYLEVLRIMMSSSTSAKS